NQSNLQVRRKKRYKPNSHVCASPPFFLAWSDTTLTLLFWLMSSRCNPLPYTIGALPQQGSSARDLLDVRIPAEGHYKYEYGTPTNTTHCQRTREKKKKIKARGKTTVEKIKTKDDRPSAIPTLK
ncbi:unnamed protein product, partial [Ectocarpus fasciculatus]